MYCIRNHNRIISLTKTIYHNIFQTAQKSYYQIIGVSKTATAKQIRSQFLKKARQLHPDHNPSSQAQQQFKILKQAYQTLKDPQKRYIYDSGISTDGINQNVYSNSTTWKQSGRKYYENKWYDYKKSNYEDQRDIYYQAKFQQDQDAYQQKLWYRGIGLTVIIIGYFGYDYLIGRKTKQDVERQHIKYIMEGQQQDKKTRKIRRYIQQRAKVNRVQ